MLVLALFSVVLATLFGWVSLEVARGELEGELDRRLIWTAGAAAEIGLIASDMPLLVPGEEEFGTWRAYHSRLQRLRAYVDDAWVFDVNTKRAKVTSAPADSIPIDAPLRFLEPYEAEIAEAIANQNGSTSRVFQGPDGRAYKYGFKQLEQSDYMVAVQAPADFIEPLDRLETRLWIGSGVGLLLALSLANLLAANIARPVERLSRAALRIQRGHMDRKVELDRGDELGRLAQAMERMRIGIQQRDEQLRLMLAQVAHEIRNPLGGLELFASAVGDAETPEEQSRIIGRIREEVSGLNRIINEFLSYARPTRLDREMVDLRGSIEAAAQLAEVQGEAEIEVDLPDEPLVSPADADQIKRLVLNLLRNGTAVAKRVRVSGSTENGEVVIRVVDDGPGIPAEMVGRIFDPFVTDKEQGAGLGLAIVRKVAEAHDGRVEVESPSTSEFGKGAEFRVYLPGLEDFTGGASDPDDDSTT